MLRIYETILEVVAGLRPVIGQIERRDRDLARQMRRAACSVVLNTAEGMNSGGGNRPARYQTAAGSMRETLACVEVGVALGYVAGVDAGLVDPMRKVIGKVSADCVIHRAPFRMCDRHVAGPRARWETSGGCPARAQRRWNAAIRRRRAPAGRHDPTADRVDRSRAVAGAAAHR
jgi:four helix bundle protein